MIATRRAVPRIRRPGSLSSMGMPSVPMNAMAACVSRQSLRGFVRQDQYRSSWTVLPSEVLSSQLSSVLFSLTRCGAGSASSSVSASGGSGSSVRRECAPRLVVVRPGSRGDPPWCAVAKVSDPARACRSRRPSSRPSSAVQRPHRRSAAPPRRLRSAIEHLVGAGPPPASKASVELRVADGSQDIGAARGLRRVTSGSEGGARLSMATWDDRATASRTRCSSHVGPRRCAPGRAARARAPVGRPASLAPGACAARRARPARLPSGRPARRWALGQRGERTSPPSSGATDLRRGAASCSGEMALTPCLRVHRWTPPPSGPSVGRPGARRPQASPPPPRQATAAPRGPCPIPAQDHEADVAESLHLLIDTERGRDKRFWRRKLRQLGWAGPKRSQQAADPDAGRSPRGPWPRPSERPAAKAMPIETASPWSDPPVALQGLHRVAQRVPEVELHGAGSASRSSRAHHVGLDLARCAPGSRASGPPRSRARNRLGRSLLQAARKSRGVPDGGVLDRPRRQPAARAPAAGA